MKGLLVEFKAGILPHDFRIVETAISVWNGSQAIPLQRIF
jgi:hypothetical protein